jgi:hypothetical protein
LRNALFRRANFPEWLHPQSWLKLLYDLGVGSLVSPFFYWLVVRIPEREKRKRIKRSFANVADGSYEYGFHETLVDHKVQSLFRAKSISISRSVGRL